MTFIEIQNDAFEKSARIADLGAKAAEELLLEERDEIIKENYRIRASVCHTLAKVIRMQITKII